MNIEQSYLKIKSTIPQSVKLVAVSKTKPIEDIKTLYSLGQRVFGENKVQELVSKYEELPKDIQWHMIGHLQTNKVKYIAPFISVIHSVDSFKLLTEINNKAKNSNRTIDCLLQFHVAKEEAKFGFKLDTFKELFNNQDFTLFPNVRIIGIMGMASFTSDKSLIISEFNKLSSIFNQLKQLYFIDNKYFTEISMGMSGDYLEAIAEGATMVRVGSSIFGARNYH